MFLTFVTFIICSAFVSTCLHIEPSNPFPPPDLTTSNDGLEDVFKNLEATIRRTAASGKAPWATNRTEFAVELTSTESTIWKTSYAISDDVTDKTYFRIASITKVFTVLAVLLRQKAGKWSIKDSIAQHVPELTVGDNGGGINWEAITLESLASQLSGIPREYHQLGFENPLEIGLPPINENEIPECGFGRKGSRPCSREELIFGFKKRTPLFMPNYQSTYSNMAFVLLGFALESSSGCSFKEVLSSTIYEPLGLGTTSLTKPNRSQGAIPDGENDWHTDFGKYEATGGIYSTSSDMSILARAILIHKLLDEATTNAWFAPRSYSSSLEFAYGMPWEIFRTTSLLQDSQRSQTIISKAGNVRGYASRFVLFPEYGVGLTVLVAGDGRALTWIEEEILKAVLPKIEEIARQQVYHKYTGTYVASPGTVINSSVDLEFQGSSGLVVTSWISNDTDFQHTFATLWKKGRGTKGSGRVQLTPSRIRRGPFGEVWHAQVVTESLPNIILNTNLVEDIDPFVYASRAIEEFIFQHNEEGDVIGVELPALQITLSKKTTKKAHPGPRTQGQKLLEVQHSAKY